MLCRVYFFDKVGRDSNSTRRSRTQSVLRSKARQSLASFSFSARKRPMLWYKASVFFNEINPLRDLWNTLRVWNIASQCEMPAGVSGFISFHFLRQQKISQWPQVIISHFPQGKYFTETAKWFSSMWNTLRVCERLRFTSTSILRLFSLCLLLRCDTR